MKEIKLNRDFITLGQLLKLTGIAETGADAKQIILSGIIKVNGQVILQRGKKLYKGDKVSINDEDKFIIV